MEEYSKEEFQELLVRYNNGCIFLSQLNPKDDKYNFYLNKLLEILNQLEEMCKYNPDFLRNI